MSVPSLQHARNWSGKFIFLIMLYEDHTDLVELGQPGFRRKRHREKSLVLFLSLLLWFSVGRFWGFFVCGRICCCLFGGFFCGLGFFSVCFLLNYHFIDAWCWIRTLETNVNTKPRTCYTNLICIKCRRSRNPAISYLHWGQENSGT